MMLGRNKQDKWMNTSAELPEAQQDTALNLHYFLSSWEIMCQFMTATSSRKSLESLGTNSYTWSNLYMDLRIVIIVNYIHG